jgi:hypothetical protein
VYFAGASERASGTASLSRSPVGCSRMPRFGSQVSPTSSERKSTPGSARRYRIPGCCVRPGSMCRAAFTVRPDHGAGRRGPLIPAGTPSAAPVEAPTAPAQAGPPFSRHDAVTPDLAGRPPRSRTGAGHAPGRPRTHAASRARPAGAIQDRMSTVFPLPAGADMNRAFGVGQAPEQHAADTTPLPEGGAAGPYAWPQGSSEARHADRYRCPPSVDARQSSAS